jgi:glycosyltransferase involved in cell wall biosynthesis
VIVPNAVEVREPLPVTDQRTLLFLGALDYAPNANAAALLIDQIFPSVREAVPDARLIIAGPHAERVAASRQRPGVEFTGFVQDLETLYRHSRVVCVPIRSGGGTRVKIIEAAAFGKPVVSTTLGAEGLTFRDGRDLLIRDDPASFSAACASLLSDDAACSRLGLSAHATASAHYDRSAIVEMIRDVISFGESGSLKALGLVGSGAVPIERSS